MTLATGYGIGSALALIFDRWERVSWMFASVGGPRWQWRMTLAAATGPGRKLLEVRR